MTWTISSDTQILRTEFVQSAGPIAKPSRTSAPCLGTWRARHSVSTHAARRLASQQVLSAHGRFYGTAIPRPHFFLCCPEADSAKPLPSMMEGMWSELPRLRQAELM